LSPTIWSTASAASRIEYSGATAVLFRRARNSASFSWMCALSASITAQRSRVAGVAKIVFAYPS
jgi:hypothetical protein